MKTTLSAFALCGIVFAANAHADERLIGEWRPVKVSCEGGKVLRDTFKNKDQWRVFDKISTTKIWDMSGMDKDLKAKGCELNIKTNYSIQGNQYTIGPFLELLSPKCSKLSSMIQEIMKYSKFYLEELGRPGLAKIAGIFQRIKESGYPPFEFKISDDNRKLQTYLSKENSKEDCPGSRNVMHYQRVK